MSVQDEHKIEEVMSALKGNRFGSVYAATREEARRIILEMIPLHTRVGIGDSASLRQIGVIEELEKRGTEIVNPFCRELTSDLTQYDAFEGMLRKSLASDVFLTGANAVTMDGKLVYIDGVGNRIAGVIFGPKKVILAVGRNKIVPTVEEALARVKNVIAPVHARQKKKATPCATTGSCSDCNSKERICSITTVVEKNPLRSNITVILIDEDLGLAWDAAWPRERQAMIESEYAKVTWEFVVPRHPKKASNRN